MTDDVVWQIINHGFCSFKTKTRTQTFCRNPYNVSGLCLRSACPLANSRYATILEEDGICYLATKTIERAHMPKDLWEKVKLPNNYAAALGVIDTQLQFFPKYLRHKSKQRLTKIHQYLIRMRKLRLKSHTELTRVNQKEERQERRKEERAEKAALVDRAIEKELLERLRQGTYGDIYNFPSKMFDKVLDQEEHEEEEEEEEEMEEDELEYVEDDDGEEDYDDEDDDEEDDDEDEDDDGEDSEQEAPPPKKKPKTAGPPKKVDPRQRRARVEIEYEEEREQETARH